MPEIISDRLQNYLDNCSSTEPDYLRLIREETTTHVHSPHMISGHHQGRLLAMLSKLVQPRLVLEIGTYTAYSALCLAEGLVTGGEVITIEKNSDLKDRILKNIESSPFHGKITTLFGDAHEILKNLTIRPDLVFLDADKRGYKSYFECILPGMPSGGLILADNVLWSGQVLDPGEDKKSVALDEFNKMVAIDPRVEVVILPVRDGLTVIRKK